MIKVSNKMPFRGYIAKRGVVQSGNPSSENGSNDNVGVSQEPVSPLETYPPAPVDAIPRPPERLQGSQVETQPAMAAEENAALGIGSMVVGILSLVSGVFFYVSIPLGIAAIVTGIFAINKRRGKVFGIVGIVTGGIGLAIGALLLLMVLYLYQVFSVEEGLGFFSSLSQVSTASTGSLVNHLGFGCD